MPLKQKLFYPVSSSSELLKEVVVPFIYACFVALATAIALIVSAAKSENA